MTERECLLRCNRDRLKWGAVSSGFMEELVFGNSKPGELEKVW